MKPNEFKAFAGLLLLLLGILIITVVLTGCSGGWEVAGYELDKIWVMQEFIDIYLQAGAAGLVCILFAFMIMNLIRSQRDQTEDLEQIKKDLTKLATEMSNSQSMVIKLVDRWNTSDQGREKFFMETVKEINDLSDVIMEIKGSVSRINGRGRWR